jgi:hypothetical protein
MFGKTQQWKIYAFFHSYRIHFRLASILFLATSIWIIIQAFVLRPDDGYCVAATSSWSPALEVVDYTWETYIESARWEPRSVFVGRHRPSLEVEKAWESLLPGLDTHDYSRI